MGVACGCVGDASVWAWLGVQCGGRGLSVGVACGECVGGATVLPSSAYWSRGGRWAWLVRVWVWPLCGCGLRCNVRAWSDVAWAWLSVCGRGLIVPI